MKFRSFRVVFMLLALFITMGVYSQQTPNVLHIELTNLDDAPIVSEADGELRFTFSNPDMETLFSGYTLKNFRSTYSMAGELLELTGYGEDLTRVFTVEIAENEVDLYAHLIENGTDLINHIEYSYPVFPTYTPNDYDLGGLAGQALDKISIRDAWDLSDGDIGVRIAIVEIDSFTVPVNNVPTLLANGFDTGHPDFVNSNGSSQIHFIDDQAELDPQTYHASSVAGIAGAAVNNGIGVTGSGFKCRLMLYSGSGDPANVYNTYDAIIEAAIDGADIINCSWGNCTYNQWNQSLVLALNNAFGCFIVAGGGNASAPQNVTDCDGGPSVGFPVGGVYKNNYFYPASYCGVFAVGSANLEDSYAQGTISHTFNDRIDITSVGYNVTSIQKNSNLPSGGLWGTSFGSPLTAGVAGLIFAENPCFKGSAVADIIKSTTDDISSLHNNASYAGYDGTGRLNAHAAVEAAQTYFSDELDLYIKDRPEDLGVSGGYHWQADRDNSPDIWVRNQSNGEYNHTHQDPEYTNGSPVYVYVRVRNKSCVVSSGDEELALYWSKASSWASWPDNWDGSSPQIGNQVDVLTIPVLEPGEEVIMEFEWNILNPGIFDTWSSCLLARIENSAVDGITVYPDKLNDDVYFNNNIAWKNVSVIDMIPGIVDPGGLTGLGFDHKYQVGRTIYVGNPTSTTATYGYTLSAQDYDGNNLSDIAEISVLFDEDGWAHFSPYFDGRADGVRITGEREITVAVGDCTVVASPIICPPNTRFPIHIGVNFLTENQHLVTREGLPLDFRQYDAVTGEILGGEHFTFNRTPRDLFSANGGGDIQIELYDSAGFDFTGTFISEPAEYRWYSSEGELLSSTNALHHTITGSTTLIYEVTAHADGYKDYDEVNVTVIPHWINSVSPNPANDMITVSYQSGRATSTQLVLTNIISNESTIYDVDNATDGSTMISVASLVPGNYDVILVCDGQIWDTEKLVVN